MMASLNWMGDLARTWPSLNNFVDSLRDVLRSMMADLAQIA